MIFVDGGDVCCTCVNMFKECDVHRVFGNGEDFKYGIEYAYELEVCNTANV